MSEEDVVESCYEVSLCADTDEMANDKQGSHRQR